MAAYKGPSSSDPAKERFVAFMRGQVAFTEPYIVGDHEIASGWTEASAGGGLVKRGARSKALFDTAAGGGGVALALYGVNRNASGFPLFFPNTASAKFGAEMRARLTTGVYAALEANMGDGVEYLVGFKGSVSLTNWSARFSNGPTNLISSIAVDSGTFHRFRIWRDGTTTFFQVDNETPVSSLNAFATNEERFQLRTAQNGTATQAIMEVDYAYLMADPT